MGIGHAVSEKKMFKVVRGKKCKWRCVWKSFERANSVIAINMFIHIKNSSVHLKRFFYAYTLYSYWYILVQIKLYLLKVENPLLAQIILSAYRN